MKLAAERDAAVEAATRAADLIRYKRGSLSREDVREKGKHDLVTVVDEQAEKLIVDFLSKTFPNDAFLAEEGSYGEGDDGRADRRWIIDPIDGTTNFAHDLAPFCVSIALEIDGRLCVGVIYEIGRDELFTAVNGEGAFVNGRPIHVSRTTELDNAVVTTGFPFREFSNIDGYMTVLRAFMERARAVRRPGSAAADLAFVAAGRMDGFFETGLSAWDLAAGALLISEAGGRVSDVNGADRFLESGRILASNGRVHEEMLRLCAPLKAEP